MLWLSRPAVLRPVLAALALVLGLTVELAPDQKVEHPFATRDLAAGATIDERDIEYRRIPAGLLAPVSLPTVTDRAVMAGEPLTRAADPVSIPPDWWSLQLTVPAEARSGSAVRLVMSGSGRIEGVDGVVASTRMGEFGEPMALVAVPPSWADLVAAMALSGELTVLIRP